VERLTSAKEDLRGQLRDKDNELAGAKSEASRYQIQYIRSAEVLRDEVLELLAQCNLEVPQLRFLSAPSDLFMSG
jgi:hypothetical protein